jgi:hypothetical protein
MTFKAGDKVYSIRHGIVTLVEIEDENFPIGIKTEIGIEGHTAEGKCLIIDKRPSIITLEKAERKGFVRKKWVQGKQHVRYIDTRDNSINTSVRQYESSWDFEDPQREHLLFIHFVDEQGNRCDWPQATFEWEEI